MTSRSSSGDGGAEAPFFALVLFGLVSIVLTCGCGADQRLQSSDPPDPPRERWARVGEALAFEGDRGLRGAEKLAQSYPESPVAQRLLQDARRQALDKDTLVNLYRRAAETTPTAMNYYLLGRAQITAPEAAKDAFDAARNLDPTFPWPVVGLAYLLEREGDLFQAVALYRGALERAPYSALLRHMAGRLYLRLRLPVDAHRELRLALHLAEEDPEVWFSYAQAEASLGRRALARRYFEAALERDPKMGPVYPRLAALLIDERCPERAATAYREGLRLGEPPDLELEASIRALKKVGTEHADPTKCAPSPEIPGRPSVH